MENEKKRETVNHAFKIGASMLSFTLLQPLDMIKVRMQLGQGSGVQIASNMLKSEGGYAAFYKGFSATLIKVPLQKVVRVGSYSIFATIAIEENAKYGITAGIMAWACRMPIELAQIRMQADATFPTAHRRNYTNVFNALNRVIADEGVRALWRGVGPTLPKDFALATGTVSSYFPSYRYLKDSLACGDATSMIGASAISSFFGCASSLPFDYVKTQLQSMQPDAYGKYPYTGFFDCARKTFKTGGLAPFYSGFYFYYFRLASSMMISWFVVKLLCRLDASIGEKNITGNVR